MTDSRLDRERLASRLDTRCVGRTIEVLDEVDSTNRYVLDQACVPQSHGRVVLAERQTAGRGRHGRTWSCPAGAGILCTVGLLDPHRRIDANLLSLVVPVAICDGIHSVTDVHCEIKWPNDIIASGRKLGGVLIESRACAGSGICYAVGFGVNCLQHRGHFPPELRDLATSLDLVSAEPIDRAAVLAGILSELDVWLCSPSSWSAMDICERWKQHALGLGARLRVFQAGVACEGHLIDIDPTAAILVQLDRGGRRLFDAASTRIEILV